MNRRFGFQDKYQSTPLVFYPDIPERGLNGKWVGFGQLDISHEDYSEEENLVLHEIGAREAYEDIIPIFVKSAELNYLFSSGIRNDEKDEFIERYYGDVIEDGKNCIKEIIDEVSDYIDLGGTYYEVINIIELKEATAYCDARLPPIDFNEPTNNPPLNPPNEEDEICGNGIDDDGDGEIDEDDCLYEVEVDCGNEVDDDGDGLIDENDPDCDCICLRDCQQDHNYLIRHAFDQVHDYYVVTSENLPGKEKLIDLRYDITRLNAPACPPGVANCPFTTNHKVVTSRATMLTCEGYEGDLPVSEFNALCMGDVAEWNAKPDVGFFYGFVSDNDVWGSPNSNDWISFGVIDGTYAVIIGTNFWYSEKVYYLPASGDDHFNDWDASVYGDLIRVNVSEIDSDQISASNSENLTTAYNFTTEFESTAGFKISVPIPGIEGSGLEISNQDKFKFVESQTTTKTVTHTFSIQAANLSQLGDFDLYYCADNDIEFAGNSVLPNEQGYNTIDEQSGIMNWWEVVVEQE